MHLSNKFFCFTLGLAVDVSEQNENPKQFQCNLCNKLYKQKAGLYNHQKYECGKEPQFQCPHCPYKAKLKGSIKSHIVFKHLKIN